MEEERQNMIKMMDVPAETETGTFQKDKVLGALKLLLKITKEPSQQGGIPISKKVVAASKTIVSSLEALEDAIDIDEEPYNNAVAFLDSVSRHHKKRHVVSNPKQLRDARSLIKAIRKYLKNAPPETLEALMRGQ